MFASFFTASRLQRLLTVLLLLPGFTAAARPLVLCVAPGDHVAVEVGAVRCSGALDGVVEAPSATAAFTCGDDCRSCVDVPLSRQVATLRAASPTVPEPAPTALAVVAASPELTGLQAGPDPDPLGDARDHSPTQSHILSPLRC